MVDPEIVAEAQRGDAGAREGLLRDACRCVFRYHLRLSGGAEEEAQDLAHETMLRVIRALGQLRAADRFVPRVLRIAANVWRDARRKIRQAEGE